MASSQSQRVLGHLPQFSHKKKKMSSDENKYDQREIKSYLFCPPLTHERSSVVSTTCFFPLWKLLQSFKCHHISLEVKPFQSGSRHQASPLISGSAERCEYTSTEPTPVNERFCDSVSSDQGRGGGGLSTLFLSQRGLHRSWEEWRCKKRKKKENLPDFKRFLFSLLQSSGPLILFFYF